MSLVFRCRNADMRRRWKDLDIQSFRERIDGIDAQIHQLLNERARVAKQVGASKVAQGLHTEDFYRPEREAQVLRKAGPRCVRSLCAALSSRPA